MNAKAAGLALLALVTTAGAAHATRPFEMPPGQAHYEFMCGAWWSEEPQANWMVFDVCFCGWDGGTEYTGPTESQRRVIRDLGGKILYEFHVPYIRARLPVASVPQIDFWCWAVGVKQPKRYDVEMILGLNDPLSAEDRSFLESLGVVILREPLFTESVLALVPDASIPVLREDGRFRYIEPNGRVCPLKDGDDLTPTRLSERLVQNQGPGNRAPQSETWGRVKAHYR